MSNVIDGNLEEPNVIEGTVKEPEDTEKTVKKTDEPNVIKGTKMTIYLKELRNKRNLSQHRLAQLCDMTIPNLQKYEYGKMKSIPFLTLERMCNALNCQPGDLFTLKTDAAMEVVNK